MVAIRALFGAAVAIDVVERRSVAAAVSTYLVLLMCGPSPLVPALYVVPVTFVAGPTFRDLAVHFLSAPRARRDDVADIKPGHNARI